VGLELLARVDVAQCGGPAIADPRGGDHLDVVRRRSTRLDGAADEREHEACVVVDEDAVAVLDPARHGGGVDRRLFALDLLLREEARPLRAELPDDPVAERNERDEAGTAANSAKWGKDKLAHGKLDDLLAETFVRQSLQVGSSLFRKSSLDAVDFMRFEADGCEDFDLLVRCALADQTAYFIPERLMEYRFHGGQNSLKQDIHFLTAKSFCLNSYRFPDRPDMERNRINNLASLKQVLAMRLIEKGETQKGRTLIAELKDSGKLSSRAQVGKVLSYLPAWARQLVFNGFRQMRPKDYSEKVRNAAG
ncbi:MAG: hypothetical protein ACFB16_13380, partial [Phormidesmis sp.]